MLVVSVTVKCSRIFAGWRFYFLLLLFLCVHKWLVSHKYEILTNHLFSFRDRCLHRWLPLMASTTVTAQMYEENSFMRNPSLTNFIVHILDSLTEFDITLESSLLRGLDI